MKAMPAQAVSMSAELASATTHVLTAALACPERSRRGRPLEQSSTAASIKAGNLRPYSCATILLSVFLIFFPATLAAHAPQTDPDSLFNQAVAAYNQNQFSQAMQKFKQVSGPHAQEAQQYIARMTAYQEAMAIAKSALDRSPDEQDANNLEFAILQIKKAMVIKPDGPWDPKAQLERAQRLKLQIEQQRSGASKAMDAQFCTKALTAAQLHHYKEAAELSCAVANDNPGYNCGGNEAVYLCRLNSDMSKLPGAEKAADSAGKEKPTPPPITPSPSVTTSPAASGSFDKAKAAYDRNDFSHARSLFEHVNADSKPAAADYLDKISRYNDAVANAEKQSRAGQYDQARTSYLNAAAIKPDGPGDPQKSAARMELLLGLDQFYSGDYASAIPHLQDCANTASSKQPLARFYLGASELARFFVTGGEDSNLHQEALDDLKQAKQAGFKTTGQDDVSPRILQAYKDLTF